MEKLKNYKLIISVFSIILLIAAFGFINGYRLSPIQAVKASSFIEGDIKIFGEVNRDWGKIYLVEAENGIKTAIAERKGFLWRCPWVAYLHDDIIRNDRVKTVGLASIAGNNSRQITVFAVQTNDPDVKFIEAGKNLDMQRKAIGINETVIFEWNKRLTINDINAVALSKDNLQLYKYQYNLEHKTYIDPKQLRWYPQKQ